MRGSAGTKTYLKENSVISSTQQCIIELNMNRYADIATPDDSVYGSTEQDQKYYKNKFPVLSVCEPERPTSGIIKPKFGRYTNLKWETSSTLSNNFSPTDPSYNSAGDYYTMSPRVYAAGPDDKYKYFTSSIAMPTIQIDYTNLSTNPVWTNHIYVCFERSAHYPTAYTIQIKPAGGSWTTIATNPTIASNGTVKLYRSGGSWSTTESASPALSDAIKIEGIRIVPTAMNIASGYLAVIEISPRVRVDATSLLQQWSITENLSEDDLSTPVGTVSANSGSVTFSNKGWEFEPHLISPSAIIMANIAKKYAVVKIYQTINSEKIQLLEMYCDDWTISEGDEAEAPLFDKAIIFQDMACPELVFRNIAPTIAIVRLLDSVGFNNVKIRKSAGENEPKINWFYFDKERTVWDVIQSICKTYQCAAWFDSSGSLNVATKGWLYGRTASSWTFMGQTSGATKSDILDHQESIERPVNRAVVKFVPTASSRSNDPGNNKAYKAEGVIAYGRLATRTLYSPERGVLLGTTYLRYAMDDSQTYCYIDPSALTGGNWGNFSGYFLVDQEIIKFEGLEFTYYVGATARYRVIKNPEELTELYTSSYGKVAFTGKISNLARGEFGTTPAAHGFSVASYSIPSTLAKYVSVQNDATVNSRVLMISDTRKSGSGITTAYKNLTSSFNTYRVKFKIAKTGIMAGGIIICATKNGSHVITDGYRIRFSADGKNSGVMVIRDGGATKASVSLDATILPDTWYDVTITVRYNSSGKDRISISGLGGTLTANFNANGIPYTKAYALFAGASSKISFDWFAAGNGGIDSGYTSQNQAIGNILMDKNGLVRDTSGVFESFGDTLREIYVETIKFSKTPALSVRWYPSVNFAAGDTATGPNVALVKELAAGLSSVTPYSARIAVANIGSRSVYLDTIDSNLYPLVFGQIVEQQQEIEVEKKDEVSIRRFGENKIELSPEWLTTRAAADEMTAWIVNTMASGREIHEITCFDNILIEVGDVVDINYTVKGITTATKYLVQAVDRSWSDGVDTKVRLVKLP